ncbi:MAG: SpoIIE family protein phosphatase [Thermoanaerobaculia bacterium]|nr:MAG: SpoIIE family protein phosphatase [Thermoanaerobaculia bacterium]
MAGTVARWFVEIEAPQLPRATQQLEDGSLVVGRGAECGLRLPDPRVSRQHCRLELRADGLWVEDLGSRRGTRLNGRPLDTPTRLADGDALDLSEESRLVVRERDRAGSRDTSTESLSSTLFRDADSMLERQRELRAAASATELRAQAERLHLLNEVHRALAESPSRDGLLDLILDRVFRLLAPEQAAVLLLDARGEPVHAVTRPAGLVAGEVFFSRSLVQEVTRRRLAALVLDAPADDRFAGAASIVDSGVRSVLAAPLLVPGGVLGMLVLSSRLRVRQFGEPDLELLVSLAGVAALHLRNLDLAEEAAERRRLEQELVLARRIQLALLPSELPEVPGYGLLAGNLPSRGVSGDLYTASRHPESGALTLLIADVSGKGMAASLLGASLEALAAGPIEVDHQPDGICVRVSRRLFARTPPEKYATAFVARLDPARHRLAWANAGHNPALLARAPGRIERLEATGPPLGLLERASYGVGEVALDPGDLLVVYTDGITEAIDPEEEEFGLARLEAVIGRHAQDPLAELRLALERALDGFVRGVPFADDRTLLVLRREAS